MYLRRSGWVETFTCRERPCDRGAAEERDELAAFHHEEFPTSSEYSWMKNGRFAGGKLDPTASEAPRFKSRNISAAIAADVKEIVVIDDGDGRLLDACDCAPWRAALGHDLRSRPAGNVN
jgi:hypothetical protein